MAPTAQYFKTETPTEKNKHSKKIVLVIHAVTGAFSNQQKLKAHANSLICLKKFY
jgi:hypothetical protein